MATNYVNFDGYAHWARVYEDDYDEYLGEKKWQIDLEMNDESVEEFLKSGLQLKMKDIGEGRGVRFRRPLEKKIKGELQKFDPPKVTIWSDKEEKYVPFDQKIGNGSKVRVNVAVYDYTSPQGPKKGHRMMGVTVLDHVPYEAEASKEVVEKYEETQDEKPW